MALAQHHSVEVRFRQQVDNARTYLLPFIQPHCPIGTNTRVMEIGCGEGGVLQAFTEEGARVLGVDLNESRIRTAKRLMADAIAAGSAEFVYKNVYDEDFEQAHQAAFDLIILKDTIEHIPNQEAFIPHLLQFLAPGGKIFFGFPPWRMPFGGHQQICENKVLGFLPWYHLLPRGIYRGILKAAGEPVRIVDELMDIKSTGISLDRFERIVRQNDLHTFTRTLFLLNPIYQYKFGWKPREQARWLGNLPWVRDFFTTAGWYLVGPKAQA